MTAQELGNAVKQLLAAAITADRVFEYAPGPMKAARFNQSRDAWKAYDAALERLITLAGGTDEPA